DVRYTPSDSHNIRILPKAVTERKLSPEAPHACKRSTTRRAAPAPSPAEARDCSGPAPPATPALPLSSTPARHRRQADERGGAGPLARAPAPREGHPDDVRRRRCAPRRRPGARQDDRGGGAGGA